MKAFWVTWVSTGLLTLATGSLGFAQQGKFDLGLRANIVGANGEPANDIPGAGIFGRYRLSQKWFLGFALDYAEFDFERPYEVVGLRQDPSLPDIDATARSAIWRAWIERSYELEGRRTEWFWTAGAGFASVDVDDISGPLDGPGTFDLSTEVGTETVIAGSGGLRIRIGESWTLETALRVDRHLSEWEVSDRSSGASGSTDDYLVKGIHLGVSRRF